MGVVHTCIDGEVYGVDTQNRQSNRARSLLHAVNRCSFFPRVPFRLTVSGSDTKIPTISEVQPNTIKQSPTINEPPIMNGLLLPHLDLELSARTPTTGCIIRPDNGPAIHTRDVLLLVNPS